MFDNDPVNATAEPWINLSDATEDRVRNIYATLFHHDLENHPWCFVTFVSKPKDGQGNHLGRLRVTDPASATVDVQSLEILATWSSSGPDDPSDDGSGASKAEEDKKTDEADLSDPATRLH